MMMSSVLNILQGSECNQECQISGRSVNEAGKAPALHKIHYGWIPNTLVTCYPLQNEP